MKYSVKFYPEKRKGIVENVPIMLSVTYSRKRMFYYTGLRCNIEDGDKKGQWDFEHGKPRNNQVLPNGKTSQWLNSQLTKITNSVNDLFLNYEAAKQTPEPEQLRKDLNIKLGKVVIIKEAEKEGFFDRFDKYITDAKLSHGRKKHLRTTYNKVKMFNPNTTFQNFDVQFLTDFQNFLISYKNKKEEHIGKITIITELKRLRAFYSYAIKLGWTTNDPFKSFKIEAETYGDPVYISIQERNKIFSTKITNEKLLRTKDMFVFQCLIGCRVGDFVKLKRSNIIDGCIEYIAGKTKDDKPRVARVPLTKKAIEIISRYDLENGDLLPYIEPQKYNKNLKELFKFAKITRQVTVLDSKTRENKQVSISDIVSSHMARRVFIGNLMNLSGVKNEVIASMSGHVHNSKSFSRYYNVEKKSQIDAMKHIE